MRGVIFDFNGTMFLDSALHERAWVEIIEKYSGTVLTEEDICVQIHGRGNDEIIALFINASLSDKEKQSIAEEKEAMYRERCLHLASCELVLGLEELLNDLKKRQVPMTIATASEQVNVDFFFSLFKLDRWFDYQQVVYYDGSFPGKPSPIIYELAAKKLGINVADCLVIEDAYMGLESANRAHIGCIVGIDPDGDKSKDKLFLKLAKDGVIRNFQSFGERYYSFLFKNSE